MLSGRLASTARRLATGRVAAHRLATGFSRRALTTFDHKDFTEKWVAAVEDVPLATDPAKSAEILRMPARLEPASSLNPWSDTLPCAPQAA